MELLPLIQSTLQLYRDVFVKSWRACVRNWPVMLATPALMVLQLAAGWVVAPLGMLGGLLMSLVNAACSSCYLVLINEVTRTGGRATLQDFRRGFGVYFSDILSVLFVLWIASMLLNVVAGVSAQGQLVSMAVSLLAGIALNVVPELIYQGRSRSTELLMESLQFVQQNWLEWFLPVGILSMLLGTQWLSLEFIQWDLSAIYGLLIALSPTGLAMTIPMELLSRLGSAPVAAISLGIPLLFGFFFLMVFRGFLFRELNGTSRRSRAFRQKFEGWR